MHGLTKYGALRRRRTLAAYAVGLVALLSAGCVSVDSGPDLIADTIAPSGVDARRSVILDYSPTVSDLGALVFVASHPDLDLIAVTLPGTGESYCGPGVAHTRGVLAALGLADVPVACGPDRPVGRYNSFPIAWRVASNELDLPVGEANDHRSAPQLIADLLRETESPVEILAIGPLTNLAIVFVDHPELVAGVAGITIMGGAVDVPGNVFRNEHGEWNFWVDPTAADLVLASGARITLVPLDATNDVPTGPLFYESLASESPTIASGLLASVWRATPGWIDNTEGWAYLWDELAAVVLVDQSLVELEQRRLVVDDDDFANEGRVHDQPQGASVWVANSVDRLAFERLFLSTVLGRAIEPGYLVATNEEIEYLATVARINRETSDSIDVQFDATSAELGLGAITEADFAVVLRSALPAIFSGPFADQLDRLRALSPPERLEAAHAALVGAQTALMSSAEAVIAAVEEGQDFETATPYFDRIGTACADLQDEARLRMLQVDLACFSG